MPQSTTAPAGEPARSGGATWADVVAANVERSGVDPAIVWTQGLESVGIRSEGPDSGGEYSCRCPNPTHNGDGDSKASLRWSQKQDGRIMVYCAAGCDFQDILDATQLDARMLQWNETRYLYRDAGRELLAMHVRRQGRAKFGWMHPIVGPDGAMTGEEDDGQGPRWTDHIWLYPDLIDAAGRIRDEGAKLVLWLPEGEKDAEYISWAIRDRWLPESERDERYVHLTTTSSGGSKQWVSDWTEQIAVIVQMSGDPSPVIRVLCDNDEAGAKRGTELTETLAGLVGANGHVEVKVWPTVVAGRQVKDAADAIVAAGARWWTSWDTLGVSDAYAWASHKTGWLHEAEVIGTDGEYSGERALSRIDKPGTKNARNIPVAVGPVRVLGRMQGLDGTPRGWEIEVAGRSVEITVADLGPSGIGTWNAKVGALIVGSRGVAEPLRAFLSYHGERVGATVVFDHEGWHEVGENTGDWVFATREGMLLGSDELRGGRADQGGADLWAYGVRNDAEEMARIVDEVLSFRDLDESGPALSWLASVAVLPWALNAAGAGRSPMLQAVGVSGHGKTRWLELASRCFGYKAAGVGSVTKAGLVRMLASSSGVVWIDDASLDEQCADLVRSSVTGGGRMRGNIDGDRGVTKDEAVASVLYSAEAGFRLNERAMRQRSVVVRFDKGVQRRESRWRGGVPQYEDMRALGAGGDHEIVTQGAGTLVRELVRVAATNAEIKVRGESGHREAGGYRFVQYGSKILALWLQEQGYAETAVALLRAVEEWVSESIKGAVSREISGADQYAITEMIPRWVEAARKTGRKGLVVPVAGVSPESVREAVREAYRGGDIGGPGGLGTHVGGAPAVVMLEVEGKLSAMVVSPDQLYWWATGDEGRRAGVREDVRHTGLDAIRSQVSECADDGVGLIRAKLSGSLKVGYRVITNPATIDLWGDDEA